METCGVFSDNEFFAVDTEGLDAFLELNFDGHEKACYTLSINAKVCFIFGHFSHHTAPFQYMLLFAVLIFSPFLLLLHHTL